MIWTTPEGNLAITMTLLTIFSSLMYMLYSSDEGWTPAFHLLFFITLFMCSVWSMFTILQVGIGDLEMPPLKHFVNALLISFGSAIYYIVSFLMYVVEEKTKMQDE